MPRAHALGSENKRPLMARRVQLDNVDHQHLRVIDRASSEWQRLPGDASKPLDSRNYAKQLLERKAPPGTPTSRTVAQIKEERRKTMKRLSDEALEDFDRLTAEILAQQL